MPPKVTRTLLQQYATQYHFTPGAIRRPIEPLESGLVFEESDFVSDLAAAITGTASPPNPSNSPTTPLIQSPVILNRDGSPLSPASSSRAPSVIRETLGGPAKRIQLFGHHNQDIYSDSAQYIPMDVDLAPDTTSISSGNQVSQFNTFFLMITNNLFSGALFVSMVDLC